LSGGYDSTAVASILQSGSKKKIKTFTIGFEEGNNEAPFAKETAAHLGTDHTEYYCTTREAQDIIKELPYYYDEPFGDSSAIPTMLVSRMAKKQVDVALSADAGDELFFGYSGHFAQSRNLKRLNLIPTYLKPVLKRAVGPLISFLPLPVEKRHKAESFFKALHENEFTQAQKLFSLAFSKPDKYISDFLKDSGGCSIKPFEALNTKSFQEVLDVFLAVDYQNYLQNDILVKVDRATMSVSLEGREPLLDHRLLEYAAQLPIAYKYNQDGKGKRILKDIVHEYVPKEMMERPKAGFSVPIMKWLRGELSYLIDDYLSRECLEKTNVFNVDFVLKEVALFKVNKMHYSPVIWYILMFQMWYRLHITSEDS
jgi:asparagine synthase (glutamine-hydrolysing)